METILLPVGPLQANCILLSNREGECLVVDPGGEAQRIQSAAEERGWIITGILLTHAHADHIGAAEALRAASGAPIAAPRGEEEALSDPRLNLSAVLPGERCSLTADRLLDDGEVIEAAGLRLETLFTPGHTAGGACYLCGKTLITGDTLFCEGMGRTDFPGGDLSALITSLRRLNMLEGDVTVLPGHGPATTLEHERRCNPYLRSHDSDD